MQAGQVCGYIAGEELRKERKRPARDKAWISGGNEMALAGHGTLISTGAGNSLANDDLKESNRNSACRRDRNENQMQPRQAKEGIIAVCQGS